MSDDHTPEPVKKPQVELAESTVLSLGLGLILAVVLGAANVYLGLYAGMTVSASIPAAVISMAVLRGIFRRGTILENNISQTVASTGESLAAGAIFTLPALILAGVWDQFNFWVSTGILLTGGVLGIVFMVPLRKALIVDRKDLRYPEGVACAEVLTAGQRRGSGIVSIAIGLGVGACFKFLTSGLKLLSGTVEAARGVGDRVFYFGSDMSPALLAVGYIVGTGVAMQVFFGGVIGWVIAIPAVGPYYASGESGGALDMAWTLWSTEVRYIGVGTMLVGGVFSIWNVRSGLVAGVKSLNDVRTSGDEAPRTERNMSLKTLVTILSVTLFVTFFLYLFLIQSLSLTIAAMLVMIPAAFLFAAVATYIVGLVGSSNSPVSGMTICAILLAALVIWLDGGTGKSAILATLGVAGVVCCVACTAGDVAQDLKTGQLVGATPARQQWAEILGVLVPAFFMVPVMALLHNEYVIGSKELTAPQATLIASLAKGIFAGGKIPYPMILTGLGIGVGIIACDAVLARLSLSFRMHVMPIAVGIYLPLSLSVPIALGGLLHWWVNRERTAEEAMSGSGVLFGSGLIAGEALMGIGLALLAALGIDIVLDTGTLSPILLHPATLLVFAGIVIAYLKIARKETSA